MNEHEEHITVGPVGYAVSTLVLDSAMDGADGIDGRMRFLRFGKNDLPGVFNCREQSSEWIGREFTGIIQPINGLVERKFRRRTGEDEQDGIRLTPDRSYDGGFGYKVCGIAVHGQRQMSGFSATSPEEDVALMGMGRYATSLAGDVMRNGAVE